EGNGTYRDERGLEFTVGPGQWILVFPEVAHAYGPKRGERWNEIYLCFRGPVFEAWRGTGILNPDRPMGRWLPPKRGLSAFKEFFQRIHRPDCTSLEAVCLWQSLLADIIDRPDGRIEERPPWL